MNVRKSLYLAAVGLTMSFGFVADAVAQVAAPEIDAGSGATAIALVVGVLLLAGEGLRRRAS